MIDPRRIFHSNLPPQFAGKPVEHEGDGLPALWTVFRFGVVLVAADDEAVGEILEDFEPFGLECAGCTIGEKGFLPTASGSLFNFHVEFWTRLQQ